jgi:hypothetical protein
MTSGNARVEVDGLQGSFSVDHIVDPTVFASMTRDHELHSRQQRSGAIFARQSPLRDELLAHICLYSQPLRNLQRRINESSQSWWPFWVMEEWGAGPGACMGRGDQCFLFLRKNYFEATAVLSRELPSSDLLIASDNTVFICVSESDAVDSSSAFSAATSGSTIRTTWSSIAPAMTPQRAASISWIRSRLRSLFTIVVVVSFI